MNEDISPYLWDRSGAPDAEVQRLEGLLGRYRHDQPLRPLPAPRRRHVWVWSLASAAALAVCAFAGYVALLPRIGVPGEAWKVVARGGSPTIAGVVLRGAGLLMPGAVLETDAASRAEVRAGMIGTITVEPNSRFRLLATSNQRHQLALDHGKIMARLWAPPHTFAFATPFATAWDLGCAFTLEVDSSGVGLVRVTSGWVEFEDYDHETLIPAGAVAVAMADRGPGSPYYEDASAAFRQALRRYDFETLDDSARAAVLQTLLREARPRDVYTLLTLLRVLSLEERGRVFDRAAALAPPPAGVTREGIMHRNWPMIDEWERRLGYGNVKRWWVHWPDAFSF